MQALKAQGYIDTRWYVTPAQLERINRGDRQAVDEFFEDNRRHLFYLALNTLRRMGFLEDRNKKVVEADDLINQAYVDMRCGFITFEYSWRNISRTISHIMRFAPVGGVDSTKPYRYAARKR